MVTYTKATVARCDECDWVVHLSSQGVSLKGMEHLADELEAQHREMFHAKTD